MRSSKKSGLWIAKALIGYGMVITTATVLFAAALRLPLKQLWTPYVLLFVAGAVAILIIWAATMYFNGARQFSGLLALAVLIVFSSWTVVCSHFGVTLGIFTRDFSSTFAWVGLLGAAFSAIHVFYLTYRRRVSGRVEHP
jgi:hypothetical protein